MSQADPTPPAADEPICHCGQGLSAHRIGGGAEHSFVENVPPAALADLLAVIKAVHAEHADDLCWMPADVNKIFVAAGLPPQDLRVGDKVAMRKNCDRYVDALCEGGGWQSYAELEAERDALKEELADVRGYAHDMERAAKQAETKLAEVKAGWEAGFAKVDALIAEREAREQRSIHAN